MATLVGRVGGCLVNRYLLVSTMGSMHADADFPPGVNPVDLGSPLGYWAAVSTLPGHSLGWQAPTQARGVSQPSGCHRWCLSCAVVSFPQTVAIGHARPLPSQQTPVKKRQRMVDTRQTRPGQLWLLPAVTKQSRMDGRPPAALEARAVKGEPPRSCTKA